MATCCSGREILDSSERARGQDIDCTWLICKFRLEEVGESISFQKRYFNVNIYIWKECHIFKQRGLHFEDITSFRK